MVLSCGCTHGSNFHALLRHGAPGALYQYLAADPRRPTPPGRRPWQCAGCKRTMPAAVPLPCFSRILGAMMGLAQARQLCESPPGAAAAGAATPNATECARLRQDQSVDLLWLPDANGASCTPVQRSSVREGASY